MGWGNALKRAVYGFMLASVAVLVANPVAYAACDQRPLVVFEDQGTIGRYNPFATPVAKDVRIVITNQSNSPCSFSLSFIRNSGLPFAMLNTTLRALTYKAASDGRPIMSANDTPTSGQRDDLAVFAPHEVRIQIATLTPDATQFVPSGGYTDALRVLVFDITDGVFTTVFELGLDVSATVIGACQITPPDNPTVNLTSAIRDGNTDPAIVFPVVIPKVECTSPAIVTLSGGAMQLAPPVDTGGAFDTYINWVATATFGNARATFQTDGLNPMVPVRSDRTNTDSGSSSGEIGIDVNMQSNAHPLLAGRYNGTLTIQIDPVP